MLSTTRSTSRATDARSRPKTPGRENPTYHRSGTSKRINEVALKTLIHEVARPIGHVLSDKTPLPNQEPPIQVIASKEKIALNPRTPLPEDQKLSALLRQANQTNGLFREVSELDKESLSVFARRNSSRVPRSSVAPASSINAALDDGETEYMPPKIVETYTPPFDFALPDYRLAGKSIRESAFSSRHDDAPFALEILPKVEVTPWGHLLSLPALDEEDLFPSDAGHAVQTRPTTSLAQAKRKVHGGNNKEAARSQTAKRPATTIGSHGKTTKRKISNATAPKNFSSIEFLNLGSSEYQEDFRFDV
ncbi:hypothetical protein MIND_00115900 [Mycena indigotica]|uniref:Uncharacterized protein n=1 Tax=Mycena indigotica TaxID=2126181 RepID=A0A8H6TCF1_9AGAR|nr:uncharacterized protein MIND_00115900 [Mycena indigotica]KAF7315988.1 hypothetical protein MIND_00115900 [Mycena indigotica]